MSDLRTTAEALAIAIEEELIPVADVVAWADERIAESNVPHIALCDLAMARNACPIDVANWLRSLPGEIDDSAVAKKIVVFALKALKAGADPSFIGRALFRMNRDDLFLEGEPEGSWRYWDDIDLARDGCGKESEELIVARMTAAMEEFVDS